MDSWQRHNLDGVRTHAPTASVYLTPQRRALQDAARTFAMDEVLPIANRLDPQRADIPSHLLTQMARLGYFGILIEEEYGGLGLGVFEYCLVTEELARAWMSVASIIARANGTGCDSSDPDHRAELLRRSAAGEWIGAIAFSEPQAGSDLANVECAAVRDGDEWVVTGTKRWVGNARAADFIHLTLILQPFAVGCRFLDRLGVGLAGRHRFDVVGGPPDWGEAVAALGARWLAGSGHAGSR